MRNCLSDFTKVGISLFKTPSKSFLMKTDVSVYSKQSIASTESVYLAILRSLEMRFERRLACSDFTLTRNIENPPFVPQLRTLEKDASVKTRIFHSFERLKFGKLSGISFSNCNLRMGLFTGVRSRTFATETKAARLPVSKVRSGLPFVEYSHLPLSISFPKNLLEDLEPCQ